MLFTIAVQEAYLTNGQIIPENIYASIAK